MDAGYFDDALKLAPFLHTWSLSVEEQFYLLIPLLLTLSYKIFNARLTLLLFLLAIGSFLLCFILESYSPSFSFFSIFTRLWQFIVGGLCGIFLKRNSDFKIFGRGVSPTLTFPLLLLVMLFYNESSLSVIWVTVVLSAIVCVILLSNSYRLFDKFVVNNFSVGIGNWSYSIYLYHWVIIVFYRSIFGNPHGVLDEFCLLIGTLVAGALSFYCIEKIINSRLKAMASATVFWITLLSSFILIITLSFLSHIFSDDVPVYSYDKNAETRLYREGVCFITSDLANGSDLAEECRLSSEIKNVVLVGDSHAAQWYSALAEFVGKEGYVAQYTASGCRPLLRSKGKQRCIDVMDEFFNDTSELESDDLVIFAGRWRSSELSELAETLKYMQARAINFVLIGPVVEYQQGLPRLLEIYGDSHEISEFSNYRSAMKLDTELQRIVRDSGGEYLSVLGVMCKEVTVGCMRVVPFDNSPIQFDYGHLTYSGAKMIFLEGAAKIELLQSY